MLEDLLKRESEQREEVNKLDAELKNQESNFKKVLLFKCYPAKLFGVTVFKLTDIHNNSKNKL